MSSSFFHDVIVPEAHVFSHIPAASLAMLFPPSSFSVIVRS